MTGRRYSDVIRLMRRYPRPLAVLTLLATAKTVSEWFGLAVVVGILGREAGQALVGRVPLLGTWLAWTGAMSQARLWQLGAGLVMVSVGLQAGLYYLVQRVSFRLKIRTETDLSQAVFAQYHEVQYGFLERQRMGHMVNLYGAYCMHSGGLALRCSGAVVSVVTVIGYTGLMLLVSPRLTVLGLGLLLVVGAVTYGLVIVRSRRHYETMKERFREASSIAHENLSGMRLIHLFGRQEWSKRRYAEASQAYRVAAERANRYHSLAKPAYLLFSGLTLAALLLAGSWLLGEHEALLRYQLGVLIVLMARLIGPLADLSRLQSEIEENRASLHHVMEMLRRDDKPYVVDGTRPFTGLRQEVVFEAVSFRYPTGEREAMSGVTLRLPKGEMTAVVGASGAGKSTLVHLLTRLYDCDAGRIWVDGIDLRELTLASWRKHVAVVSQEAFLYHESVLENVRMARPGATEEEVRQALAVAQASGFVDALPKGLQTPVQERGTRLSGGQRQRLAIARALLAEADLLVLDEATSELDSETELAFQSALAKLAHRPTILAIAHRLSTIRDAACIHVLDKGRVVESGTHAELMARQGRYYGLYQAQAREAEDVVS